MVCLVDAESDEAMVSASFRWERDSRSTSSLKGGERMITPAVKENSEKYVVVLELHDPRHLKFLFNTWKGSVRELLMQDSRPWRSPGRPEEGDFPASRRV